MKKIKLGKNLTAFALVWVMLMMPIAAFGQTKIKKPKNKYKVQDDVKIGREYSAKIEKELPILRDRESSIYIQNVGRRLVQAIPREFQEPAFEYNFKIINARDINAFALPGGPMYVHRGLIEVARNEGEMAGVMAHEISHVALQHGTAQATKQSNPLNQILGIGTILGGAILGGQAGAQLGQMLVAGYFLRYSRKYETQSDILGARIMANAGYDPKDLANMFKTISAQSKGGRPPEWLSSHPDPDRRFRTINEEAGRLRVSSNPIKVTRGFARIKEKLRSMPRAKSMAEIGKEAKGRQTGNTNNQMSQGRYSRNVQLPSSRTRTFSAGNWMSMRVPQNWRQFPNQTDVWFAPDGAFGNQGITHGATIGINRTDQRTLERATEEYVKGILQANTYLRQSSQYAQGSISRRKAYRVGLTGRSPITNRTETATIYTTQLRDGRLFYIVTVAPQSDSYRYNRAFGNLIRSVRLND